MSATRKCLRITITGVHDDDLEIALDKVNRLVGDKFLSGFDSNESGSYEFEITQAAPAAPV